MATLFTIQPPHYHSHLMYQYQYNSGARWRLICIFLMLTPANINYIDLNRVEVNILPCNLHFRRKALFGPSTGLSENKFFGQTNALGKN